VAVSGAQQVIKKKRTPSLLEPQLTISCISNRELVKDLHLRVSRKIEWSKLVEMRIKACSQVKLG
jgi:hypothetical protein